MLFRKTEEHLVTIETLSGWGRLKHWRNWKAVGKDTQFEEMTKLDDVAEAGWNFRLKKKQACQEDSSTLRFKN